MAPLELAIMVEEGWHNLERHSGCIIYARIMIIVSPFMIESYLN